MFRHFKKRSCPRTSEDKSSGSDNNPRKGGRGVIHHLVNVTSANTIAVPGMIGPHGKGDDHIQTPAEQKENIGIGEKSKHLIQTPSGPGVKNIVGSEGEMAQEVNKIEGRVQTLAGLRMKKDTTWIAEISQDSDLDLVQTSVEPKMKKIVETEDRALGRSRLGRVQTGTRMKGMIEIGAMERGRSRDVVQILVGRKVTIANGATVLFQRRREDRIQIQDVLLEAMIISVTEAAALLGRRCVKRLVFIHCAGTHPESGRSPQKGNKWESRKKSMLIYRK